MAQQDTKLLSAYLVVGDDKLKLETILGKLMARLEREGDLDFNSQILDGNKEIDRVELLDSLNTPPLAAPFRLVVIKEVDKAKKDLTEALISYLEKPLSSTIVVMTATKLTQQSRLYKAVRALDPNAVIDAAGRKRSEMPTMVRQLAQGYRINLSHDAAAKVVDLVGTSTVALNTEIKKLAGYVVALGRSDAGMDDVLTVIARSNQPSAWDFVDAYAERNLVSSLEILNLISRESPVSLLYLCVTRLRELLQYKSLAARKEGSIAKALGKPEWQVRKLQGIAERFEARELRELLTLSARIDARMKSGEDPKRALEELVLATCR